MAVGVFISVSTTSDISKHLVAIHMSVTVSHGYTDKSHNSL